MYGYAGPFRAGSCQRAGGIGAVGRQIVNWCQALEQKWATLRFGEEKVETKGQQRVYEKRRIEP